MGIFNNTVLPKRKGNWWIGLYLILMTTSLYLTFSHWVYDDPFITYRYADNLRHGVGFVYNTGERVLSTTTPLFALILAGLGNFFPDLQQLANLIGALSLALGGVFLWDLAQTWKTPLVGWASLLLYPTFPLLLNTVGSETPLYLGFCIGAFAFYARKAYLPVAVFSALAVLTRSDGVLVPLLLIVDYSLHTWIEGKSLRDAPWRAVSLFVGLLIPWHLFAWFYFGSPLPVTLAAKQAQGAMAISQKFAPGLLRIASWYTPSWWFQLTLVLVVFGVGFALWRQRRWLLILGWTLSYFLAYSILGVSGYFWYYAPLAPGVVVALGLGTDFLQVVFSRYLKSTRLSWLPIFSSLLIGVIFIGQTLYLVDLRQGVNPRYRMYKDAGEWIDANTPHDASLGTLEVGIIGYYAHRTMIDFAGLIQPQVAEQLQPDSTYEDAAIWADNEYQPRYLVLFSGAFPRLRENYIVPNCQLAQQFFGDEYDYPVDLLIFDCLP